MIPPCGRVPEQGPDWFFMATEACGSGTSDLGLPSGFWNIWQFIERRGGAGGHRGGHNPLGAPRWVVPTSGLPSGTSLAHVVSSGPKKFSKKFRCVWTPFGTDILRSKKKQKIA